MPVLSCVAPFILSGESIFGCVTLMSWKSMQVFFSIALCRHIYGHLHLPLLCKVSTISWSYLPMTAAGNSGHGLLVLHA